jgi:hypothetical protein
MKGRVVSCITLLALGLLAVAPRTAMGQIGYPAFQPARVVDREFNFGVADADQTSTLVIQWRESVGVRSQLSIDGGISDVGRRNTGLLFILGGQYAYQMNAASAQTPIDLLFTTGVWARVGDNNARSLSVPFGIAVGHTFDLEGDMSITPIVHPRVAIDVFRNDTELNVYFDFGAGFDINSQIGLRLIATLGDTDAVGFSLVWRPLGLR